MRTYYKVWLNDSIIEYGYNENKQIPVICKRISVTKGIFREIITKKLIYPTSLSQPIKGLTYEVEIETKCESPFHIHNHYKEITNKEVESWLNTMDKNSIKYYINNINRIEEKVRQYQSKQNEERIASKNIKKSLRKIKTR